VPIIVMHGGMIEHRNAAGRKILRIRFRVLQSDAAGFSGELPVGLGPRETATGALLGPAWSTSPGPAQQQPLGELMRRGTDLLYALAVPALGVWLVRRPAAIGHRQAGVAGLLPALMIGVLRLAGLTLPAASPAGATALVAAFARPLIANVIFAALARRSAGRDRLRRPRALWQTQFFIPMKETE